MIYNESISIAKENLKKTLAFIAANKLSPNPISYTVCYEYVSGKNLALSAEVQRRLENWNRIDSLVVQEIYEQFFVEESDERSGEFCRAVENILKEILQHITTSDSGIKEYGTILEQHLNVLKSNPNPDVLKDIVIDLAKSTHEASKAASSLQHYLQKVQEEANSLRVQLELLREEASIDMLTGLLNRKSLDHMLVETMEKTVVEKGIFSLLMLDIDHFKHVNDQYGHLIGDEIIKHVGQCIKECIRGTDVAVRYGGEEFTVLLPATSIDGATKVAETIRSTIEKLNLVRKPNNEKLPKITISIGVSSYKENDGKQDIIERADKALYKSKQSGRNRVSIESD